MRQENKELVFIIVALLVAFGTFISVIGLAVASNNEAEIRFCQERPDYYKCENGNWNGQARPIDPRDR